jgi:hypothetical protein
VAVTLSLLLDRSRPIDFLRKSKTGLENMNAQNQNEPLERLESDEGAHPVELMVWEDDEENNFTALIFASLPDGRQVCIKAKKIKSQKKGIQEVKTSFIIM